VLADDSAAGDTAIALCLPEEDRPGRLAGLDGTFFALACAQAARSAELGRARRLFAQGTLGGVRALEWADEQLERGDAKQCVIVGVDSYVNLETLTALHRAGRLLTSTNSDGVIPGEAAAGVLVTRGADVPVVIECRGTGWGREEAIPGSGKPLRGDGLAQAYRAALKAAGCGFREVDYRLCDVGGDEFAFKEAALGLQRTMRVRKESFALWHTADCVGRVGAASVPLTLGVALAAARKRYAPGPGVLCHFADDRGDRAAAVLRARDTRPAPAPWWK
jgi:3-oxoacyl-[acyl-carrier-protein] synthase-1